MLFTPTFLVDTRISIGIPLWLSHITGIILARMLAWMLARMIPVMCESQSGMPVDILVSARNAGLKSTSGLTVETPLLWLSQRYTLVGAF